MPDSSSSTVSAINLYDLKVTGDCTVRVFAVKEGYVDSEVVSVGFSQYKVSSSHFTSSEGAIDFSQDIILATFTEGAILSYSMDGADFNVVLEGVKVFNFQDLGKSNSCSITFSARKKGCIDSDEETIIFTQIKVEPPTMRPNGGEVVF